MKMGDTPQAASNYYLDATRPKTSQCQSSRPDQVPPDPISYEEDGSAEEIRHLIQHSLGSTQGSGELVENVRATSRSTSEQRVKHQRLETSPRAAELSTIAEDPLKLDRAFQESDSILLDLPHRKVFRYGRAVIKFGIDVSPSEAETLRFIGTTTIPAPRLYCSCVHSSGTVVIVMEHIAGKPLSEQWPILHHHDKTKIVIQLRDILQKMRQYRGAYIGGLNKAPAVDIRMHTRHGGPFQDEEKFNEFLQSTIHSQVPEILRDMLRGNMRTDHEIVLTHGDITARHIMVDDRNTVVAILDWEGAGWYPEHWEFIKFMSAIDYSTDLGNHASGIFPKIYAHEYIIDSYLDRLLSH